MSNSVFRFKRFAVEQSGAAMKVGTDGVLLGAWARVEPSQKCFLDIGAGTGVIALMLAQRASDITAAGVSVDAVEVDEGSARQAGENFAASPWRNMVKVYGMSVQEFCREHAGERYDHIVSNPPWFVSSLRSPDGGRTRARHTDALPYADLLGSAAVMLADGGRFSVVIPTDSEPLFMETAAAAGLGLSRRTAVFTLPGALPKRVLLELALRKDCPAEPSSDTLTVETGVHAGDYTEEYRRLTADFYLKF